jgi:hypothetical protein
MLQLDEFQHGSGNNIGGKTPSFWLRVCGAIVGSIVGALGAVVFLILGAITGALSSGPSVLLLFAVFISIGTCSGSATPKQTLHSLWFFLPGFKD